jgi:hypothetical protein
MAQQIWRYPVPAARDFFLEIPEGSQFLKLIMKGDSPQLYFRVPDTGAVKREFLFFAVPSGVDLRVEEERATYLGSFCIDQDRRPDGSIDPGTVLVFHVLAEAS